MTDREPIRDGRTAATRNMDRLVMELREIDEVKSVNSDLESNVSLEFDLSELDRKTAWEGSDIPEEAATLLFENRFVPISFGREYNRETDEYLPVVWFETVESVAGRTEG